MKSLIKPRSTVGQGMKLGTKVYQPKKGPGAYKRNNRINLD